jgi:hypothetical protein
VRDRIILAKENQILKEMLLIHLEASRAPPLLATHR